MRVPKGKGPRSVSEYLAHLPSEHRRMLGELRKTIRAAAPDAEELISYQMPAFRQNGMLVYYAAFRNHLSFFVGSPRIRRQFSAELEPFETGKGTLRFTPEHPLTADLVTRIVKARVAENLAKRSK